MYIFEKAPKMYTRDLLGYDNGCSRWIEHKWPSAISDSSQMADGHFGAGLNGHLGSRSPPGFKWPTDLGRFLLNSLKLRNLLNINGVLRQ